MDKRKVAEGVLVVGLLIGVATCSGGGDGWPWVLIGSAAIAVGVLVFWK